MLESRMTIRLIIAMCLIAWCVPSISTTSAQDATPQPGAEPDIDFVPLGEEQGAFFDVEVQPGSQVSLSVRMANGGSADFDAVTYAADAYSIRNGGFGLRDFETEATGPTTWLDYPQEQFVASVEHPQERTFTITVPAGTSPGEYVTGIAMQTANPVNEAITEGMFRYDQYYRTVIGIRIRVPGPLQASIEIGEPGMIIEGGIAALSIPITNTGNQQTSPTGELTLRLDSGDLVLSAPVAMGNIYGGHQTDLWLGLSSPLPPGDYRVDLTLTDPEKNVAVERLDMPFVITTEQATGTEVFATTFSNVVLTPLPSVSDVQFANIEATISNTGDPIANAQLSLIARLDGEEVERFAVVQSLSLPTGDTPITTRYIPATGWTPGEWTFELLIESVEPGGAAVVIGRQPIEGSILVP